MLFKTRSVKTGKSEERDIRLRYPQNARQARGGNSLDAATRRG